MALLHHSCQYARVAEKMVCVRDSFTNTRYDHTEPTYDTHGPPGSDKLSALIGVEFIRNWPHFRLVQLSEI